MPILGNFAKAVTLALCATGAAWGQDLAPRAYLITPVHANAITIIWSFYDGGLNFNGTIPVANARGTYDVPVFSYYHSLNFFGRSANITAALPYGVGIFQGDVLGQHTSVYRSGLLDSSFRFSVNLMGGPAMQPKDMAKWKQKRLEIDQLGRQSMGFQTGTWVFRTLGPLGARWLCWSVVLHHEPDVLRRPGYQTTKCSADRGFGGAFELRREAALVAVTGRELLVGWDYQLEWHTEPGDKADRLAHWRHGFLPDQQTPIHQSKLQQWHIHSLRRKLSERLCGVAVFLVRPAKLKSKQGNTLKDTVQSEAH